MDNEERKLPLSRDIIRKLKCSFCESYLSMPPVMLTSLQGDEWKCGRCVYVTTEYNIPGLIFETVAASMTFPCIYPNCPAEIPWGSVKEHEAMCHFQTMKCPCGETVEVHLASWHFRHQHPDIISYNQAVIESPGYCKLHTRLIVTNHIPFMVYILCERKAEIKVGAFSLQQTDELYEVQLKITSNSTNCVITPPSKKISKFNLRENCADCLLKSCLIKYHKYYESNQNLPIDQVYEMMNIRVDTTSILNILSSDDFILTISIIQGHATENRVHQLDKNEQVRKSWECQICQEYLVGAIYICRSGHSLCNTCKTKLTDCPFCMLAIGSARNFTLEDMAEHAEIVCQYEAKGCTFVGNVEQIAKHERKCHWGKVNEMPNVKKKIRLSV